MRLEQLEYLIDIAKTSSMNVSAERLFVAQPSLSEAMTKLEDELDTTLFERSKKGVRLTKTGEIAINWAEIILKNIEDMKDEIVSAEEMVQFGKNIQGELSIGSISICNNILVSRIVSSLAKQYPHLLLKVYDMARDEIIQSLRDHKINIGLISMLCIDGKVFNQERNLAFCNDEHILVEKIFAEPMVFIADKQFVRLKQKQVSFRDMTHYPIILFQEDIHAPIGQREMLEQFGDFQITLNTNNFAVFRQALRDGVGIGLALKSSISKIFDDEQASDIINFRTIQIKENVTIDYFTLEKEEKANSLQNQLFKRRLKFLLQ
ncbi:MAG: LysR family transcriptional regulator [Peptococcaceae bacterium]|nr:LysR family transcriptional regulator [Peptococcaceae bacterium]